MRVFIRYDPCTEEATLEDEAGNEIDGGVTIERDGAMYLIGPLDVED